ncbi:hypothetical protein [Pseudozobellia thermophila]|uniref:DNA phosphorothioation-dependent restriction protein DptG n=1 Tax=Pseudozobellia thermophila TaxID=192903 RepID=A0A1M6HM70_9FLAO|nr:hypothetical protein [Pseudozobellia thermophila]SHJ23267.1 DNA phosphorothioation-dependent restriction protein DptG [Pseudozobellia thermophila]
MAIRRYRFIRTDKYLLVGIIIILCHISVIAQISKIDKANSPGKEVFQEIDGYVAVEAEDFYKQSHTGIRQWYRTTEGYAPHIEKDKDENHSLTASGRTYIELLPDTRITHDDPLIKGENFSNEPGKMAIVHYKVNINNPGRYYVWVRAFSTGTEDNGLHVGLNGTWPEHGRRMQWCDGKKQWTWASRQRTKEEHCGVPKEIYLDIPRSGLHEIQFSMREDGFEFDRFILTKDIDFIPQDTVVAAILELPGDSASFKPKIAPPLGRMAIVADGNSPDPDDLGGTAVSIALLRAAGVADRLVHYSHSCDLVRDERISGLAEKERHALMQSACDVTARRWGGFGNLTFYDAKWQRDETIQDLSRAINESDEGNPLWIIEAGEPDIIGFALEASSKAKHRFVKIITHHPANDDAGDFFTWQQILDFGVKEVRIPDQNAKLKVDLAQWDWAKDHPDPRIQWVWLQGKIAELDDVVRFQKGKWDCSDAGMVLYWITGATKDGLKQGTVDTIREILTDFVDANP